MRVSYIVRLSLGVIAVAVGGCLAPPRQMTGPMIDRGGGQLIPPDAREPAYAPAAAWSPRFGRMGTYLRSRHTEMSEVLAAEGPGQTLLAEHFETFRADAPEPWQVLGKPIMRILREPERGGYLELEAPPGPGLDGIQREIAGDRVRGQVVRVRVLTQLTSAARARRFGAPQMRWIVRTADGRKHTFSLPLIGRASPGWEPQEFLTYFDTTVRRVWLQVVHVNSSAACGFDDIIVDLLPADQFIWAASPGAGGGEATSRASGPTTTANLVLNGNFEVGPKGFSVWAQRDWPGRGRYVAPQLWYFDSDAAIGQVSLEVPSAGATANVTLGPFDLARRGTAERPAERYHLSFWAKASTPTDLEVDWRILGMPPNTQRFLIDTEWARYRHVYLTPVAVLSASQSQGRPATAELTFRMAGPAEKDYVTYWLDGVTFSASRVSEPFSSPTPIEVGVFGPAPDPTDVGELLQLGEPAAFAVRLVNCEKAAYSGTVAIDLIDALDRPVWTKTARPYVDADSTWNDQVVLTLPRGYYRVKVTAWSEAIGSSSILSQDERALAVIDLEDPVPRAGYFGLAADAGSLSARTAQLGSGWVTMPLDAAWRQSGTNAAKGGEFEGWREATEYCDAQGLNVVAKLSGLPREADRRRTFYRSWLDARGAYVSAAYLDWAEVSQVAAGASAVTPETARAWLGIPQGGPPAVVLGISGEEGPVPVTSRPTTASAAKQASRPTSAPTANASAMSDGFAFRCFAGAMMPEAAEPQLEQFGRRRQAMATAGWWDLSVAGAAGSAYAHRVHIATDSAAPVAVQMPESDPALSASCLVRAMLIRYLANADYACASVHAHRAFNSLIDVPDDCFNEYDQSPRPALAAWDWMTMLLNDAVPVRWYDKPSDARALAFEGRNGQIVVAVWRPFGRTAQRLVLKGLAKRANVYDLFGRGEPGSNVGGDLVVRVDQLVRYIVAAPEVRDALLMALETAEPEGP
jgi:hypothetical protein